MKQILDHMPLDIIPHPDGFVIIEPEKKDDSGRLRISFWFYNLRSMVVQKVKKNFYTECKFGPAYNEITTQVNDYISCSVCETPKDFFNVVFPTGELGIFDVTGTLIWTGDLLYHDCTVRSCAPDGKNIWCAVPDQNAIVRYSTNLERVDFRIGGVDTMDLGRPMSVTRYDNDLYVCCKTSCNIKKISMDNYVASDYRRFEEGVLRYLRVADHEVVVLTSGIYILD